MSETNETPIIKYANIDLPQLLEELGWFESKQGLWRQRQDKTTTVCVDFRPSFNGNPSGRRYAILHAEGKPDKFAAGTDADAYPALAEYKQRRDKLLGLGKTGEDHSPQTTKTQNNDNGSNNG